MLHWLRNDHITVLWLSMATRHLTIVSISTVVDSVSLHASGVGGFDRSANARTDFAVPCDRPYILLAEGQRGTCEEGRSIPDRYHYKLFTW